MNNIPRKCNDLKDSETLNIFFNSTFISKRALKIFNIFCFYLSCFYSHYAQAQSDTLQSYSFIKYEENQLLNEDSKNAFHLLWEKWDSLLSTKNFQINIVHFGGSHIQADIYSHLIRTKLQSLNDSLPGARGWIFPFSAAGTNNPANYEVKYTGNWEGHRSSVNSHEAIWGVNGITLTTQDSTATLKFSFKNSGVSGQFNKVKLFSNYVNNSYDIQVSNPEKLAGVSLSKQGEYLQFRFKEHLDSLELFFFKTQEDSQISAAPFAIYGLLFENDKPGWVYHAVGVNGSSFKSFERCVLFEKQLVYLNPDIAIISIGTNDSFDEDFDSTVYMNRYENFIEKIKHVNPNCALLLTVPNDSYFKSKKHNANTAVIANVIQKLAKKYDAKIWNFYAIMGGEFSAKTWKENELMKKDLVHFTRSGYELKGQLLFDALMSDYFNWIEKYKYSKEK